MSDDRVTREELDRWENEADLAYDYIIKSRFKRLIAAARRGLELEASIINYRTDIHYTNAEIARLRRVEARLRAAIQSVITWRNGNEGPEVLFEEGVKMMRLIDAALAYTGDEPSGGSE